MSKEHYPIGTVYLIGAGPGDPGLLTLRGADLLANCNVVLYDGLSNAELLKHAPNADHICVGKHGQKRIWRQEEIIDEMLRHARGGRKVVRLKGGDPAVFARTAEEIDALRAAEVPFEIVPGITAALAAGSYAGIPITHRKLASAVALITGHEEPGKAESALDWEALARFPGTLVIYMGVTTAESWTRALMNAGKAGDTPAALIRRCSHGDQQTVHCRLDEVAQRLTPASQFRPPVITILGEVTKLAETMNWLERKPLFGQTILVTRPTEQAESLVRLLRDQGANVLVQPAVEIGPPKDWSSVDAAIRNLGEFHFIVFCSTNGVRFFLNRLLKQTHDIRSLGSAKLAVVGSQTASALANYHLAADIVPGEFNAKSLVASVIPIAKNKRVLVIRASRGRDDIVDPLCAAGAIVDEVIAYDHRDVERLNPPIAEAISNGKVDWVTVASSATATNLHKLFGKDLAKTKIASLSPITSQKLGDLGYQVSAEASKATMKHLVDSIVMYER